MLLRTKQKISLFLLTYSLILSAFADTTDDPCGGPTAMLSLVDRPTIGDSACAVPFHSAILELGYQYQQLKQQGNAQNFPQGEFRLGLPAHTEFVALLPNYNHQSIAPHSGTAATTLGIKHEISYNQNYVFTAEGLVTPPSGSAAFGNQGTGGAINGILSYDISSVFNVNFMLGATTQTSSSDDGGQRYSSINPDLVLSWTPQEKTVFYGEAYGQSKTAPDAASGFNMDTGIVYLLFKNMTIDAEVGQRLSGSLGNFEHYIGSGAAVKF